MIMHQKILVDPQPIYIDPYQNTWTCIALPVSSDLSVQTLSTEVAQL
jgi:hypothetical protein